MKNSTKSRASRSLGTPRALPTLLALVLAGCGADAGDGGAFARAVELQSGGDHAAAVRAYDELLIADAEHAGALYNRGTCRLALGDAAGAVHDLTRALDAGRRETGALDVDALLWRGAAHLAAGDAGRALEDLDGVLELAPTSLEAWLLRADASAAAGDVDGALADFDAAIRLAPDDPAGYERKAELLASIGEGDAAAAEASLGAVTRRLVEHPSDAEARVRRGLAFLLLDEPDLARADLARAVELDGAGAETWSAFGQALVRSGDERAALEAFSRVVDDGSVDAETSALARLARVELYAGIGAWREALGDCEVLRHDPELADTPGGALLRVQATARAARAHAVRSDPDVRDAEVSLELAQGALEAFDAWIAARSGDGDQASGAVTPGELGRWYYLDTMALALAAGARFGEAADLQARVVAAAPDALRDDVRKTLDLYREAR